ncbi:Holliday junction DNA helicase RuvA [Orenia metallireducens]|uniref:Holliday junction branch migration complex subunit RuvA n=1 Tax=Orenia metallireducens TaxID=1413210 RepID=A0A1C0A4V2_9FIRM|nr:Holliday junction branch migration protein RuvA [Orenia metallireducens]OCL25177.1 Holliday junction DNA helicase RuvA [Orenia metallireducens]
MIAYLRGRLIRNNIEYIVIQVGGIGYKVYIPSSLQQTLPQIDEEVELHTYHYVREDNISLYGFNNVETLELFEQLLDVSKIGPKVALSILSTMPAREFKFAIVNNQINTLKEIKGIGNKTAKRLILELQEKIDLDNILGNDSIDMVGGDSRMEDAVQALISLGYKQSDATKAVADVIREDKEIIVEDIIKNALLHLS